MYSTLLEKQIIAIIFPQPVLILKNNFDLKIKIASLVQ